MYDVRAMWDVLFKNHPREDCYFLLIAAHDPADGHYIWVNILSQSAYI